MCFHIGKRNLNRNTPVQTVYNKLGHKRDSKILCFHAQTGSDMFERFAGRTNEWCFKVFKACGDDIHNALENLGHRYLPQEGIDQFDRYVCQLYTSKIYTNVNDLWWFLCSNRAAEEEGLPQRPAR